MATERWRRSTLSSLKTAPSAAHQYENLRESPDPLESKKPRIITKALRSMSSSSLDSMAGSPSRSSNSIRRLHKTPSNSSNMMERIQRRVSKEQPAQTITTIDAAGSPLDEAFYSMEMLQYGHLKTDVSLLKARSEYLVLTDHCLVKFGSVEAARGVFPQLLKTENGVSQAASSVKSAVSEIRFEVPLRSIVAVFSEEGASPRFGIEVWWVSEQPRLGFSKAVLFFSLPKERDDWLTSIQHAHRVRTRKASIGLTIPENLKIRINHIVATTEQPYGEETPRSLIFPVAKRIIGTSQKPNAAEEAQQLADGSSFYLVIGPCMCYFVEVLKADHATQPGELRVKTLSFGTVTMTRFKASVASQEQRFVMSFRAPFGREIRLDLASAHYRRIIEALTKIDRELKPMWPQQFQQHIFDIKGLPAPLQLTSGNDLGGVETSLQAHCTAFHVHVPRWTIDWHTSCSPAFRLLPPEGPSYSAMQLLAVTRALRYNSFFKAISFRDVDLSALAGKVDYSQYGDSIVNASLSGWKISEEHHEILMEAPVLSQEIHAMAFSSDTIRSIDLSNVWGLQNIQSSRMSTDRAAYRRLSSEFIRPLLILAREGLLQCHSICVSGNPLAQSDIDDLANTMVLDHVYIRKLEMSSCSLGDAGLTKLWSGISGQAGCLELINTSDNYGIVKPENLYHGLSQLQAITRLNIAGNTRLGPGECIFEEAVINSWRLKELDLSGIALNDATVNVLAGYLQAPNSRSLQLLRLNSCGLTGAQVARLFRAAGQARQMTMHINANRLDDGIDDLCSAISCGYGPWSLFIQMIEFNLESSYTKLLRALTVNKTIECLSLAGSATPDAASPATCQVMSKFFSDNDTVKFLDVSGYDSKLDEGRLGKEFSRAMSGMRLNKRIEHLRVRSQMLNFNIGDLAEAISGNTTLHTLDCEGNDFNLSNFRHLVKRLDENKNIRHFSCFSDRELEQAMRKTADIVATANVPPPTHKRHSMMSRFRHEKAHQPTGDRHLVQHLRDEWDNAVEELKQTLMRNQQTYQEACESDDDTSSRASSGGPGRTSVFSSSFGGLALREYESRRSRSSQGVHGLPDRTLSGRSATGSHVISGGRIERISSNVSSDMAISPLSDALSLASGEPTPPDDVSPTEKGFFMESSSSYDESNYVYGDGSPADSGLLMKSGRRPVGRIDEE